jgi:hypothetical protein
MARLLDKKERVYDFKLTNYGKYLLSIGEYKPEYYAFFDDNIAYDRRYFTSASLESQNSVDKRIKEDTPYLETILNFEDIEQVAYETSIHSQIDYMDFHTLVYTSNPGIAEEILLSSTEPKSFDEEMMAMSFHHTDVSPIRFKPPPSKYKVDAAIGDAYLDNKQTNVGASWKIVVLNGTITSTSEQIFYSSSVPAPDSGGGAPSQPQERKNIKIPQVNISVDYRKLMADTSRNQINLYDQPNKLASSTGLFQDNKTIYLKPQHFMAYVDEVNTELLVQNFDIEVFHIGDSLEGESDTSYDPEANLLRKYFFTKTEQIVDNLMVAARPINSDSGVSPRTNLQTNSVEYYFDVLTDGHVDKETVCRQMQDYNKSSYYIDVDFECETIEQNNIYNDIYGSMIEPEICLE